MRLLCHIFGCRRRVVAMHYRHRGDLRASTAVVECGRCDARTEYFGDATVWHRMEDGIRADTETEKLLSGYWWLTRFELQREGGS